MSDLEVLSASLCLPDLMDIRVHEASRGVHLLEGVAEVVGSLMVIVRVVLF